MIFPQVLIDVKAGECIVKEFPFRDEALARFVDKLTESGERVIGLKLEKKEGTDRTSMTVTLLTEDREAMEASKKWPAS